MVSTIQKFGRFGAQNPNQIYIQSMTFRERKVDIKEHKDVASKYHIMMRVQATLVGLQF